CRLAHVRAHPSTRTTSAPTALSPLSLHDALPICPRRLPLCTLAPRSRRPRARDGRTSFMIRFETSHGAFVVELFPKEAPITVENFQRYVDDGHFDGTIFHRIVPGFVIQGGGLTADFVNKRTRTPISNEAQNGLKNLRGTLSMARTGDINSATSQFFVNLADNA